MRANDLTFVRHIVAHLEEAGIVTWLFGGWAEELLGLSLPRVHHDIDLLYPAEDFELVDGFLATVAEITAKRFPHKRAFESEEIMVELFLVRRADGIYYTDFWGSARHAWPANVLDVEASGLRVASARALIDYRASWPAVQPSIGGRRVSAEEWLQRQDSPSGPTA
ncbi:nucleotidyltransferase domain-containing protein [Actinopolymorpha alba]|uniref:nucleotidyltransferase domain-containing protein n=1 Tax=Actinopolymorpha alba TaxID=533267 RepID=UPI0003763E9A|nr:hypothetical protein [Actinopolymorpha alba]